MTRPRIAGPGHGSQFRRKKEQAIVALLSQRTIEDAARTIGVGPNTLTRWLKLPEFQEEYRLARRQAVGQTTARLQQASGAAVTTLLKVMVDNDSPAASRVRAADTVLEYALRAMELEDIEARISRLERNHADKLWDGQTTT
jgi:transposase-like protein